MAGRMSQGNEGLAPARPFDPHMILHDTARSIAANVSFFAHGAPLKINRIILTFVAYPVASGKSISSDLQP
jgi:hypothetical protein